MSLNVLMFVPHLLDKMVTKFPSEYKNNSLSFSRDLLSNAFFLACYKGKNDLRCCSAQGWLFSLEQECR